MRPLAFVQVGVLAFLLLAGCEADRPTSPGPGPSPFGALTIDVSGMPQGGLAEIEVSGPESYIESVDATTTLTQLVPGSYAIAASNANTAQGSYTPSPSLQQVTVVANQTAQASVDYDPISAGSVDLWIGAVYLVQTTQRLNGSVPLIAGREATLRVFALASDDVQLSPQVRVTLTNAANQVLVTHTIDAPNATMPTAIDESQLDSSWNATIAPQHMVTGLKIVAEIDPTGAVEESDESNNRRPAAGTTNVDVRSLPDIEVRFVPVHQSATGLTGNVNAGNVDDFMELALKLFPTAGAVVDLRSTYTSSAPALQSNDANGAWATVLGELWTLKQAEDAASTRHYYGVVRVGYSSGVAGMAYVSSRAAIGRDLAFANMVVVFPHEFGHNLSLPHAPCGVSGDPDYPYPNGQIGVYGLDTDLELVKAPTLIDIMGYCPNIWISDYNYEQALAYREDQDKQAAQIVGSEMQACWLVWGSMHDGGVELQPVIELEARPVIPNGGDAQLELRFADGSSRILRFAGVTLADGGRDGERHFAWLLPRAEIAGARELTSVRVLHGAQSAQLTRALASDASQAATPRLTRSADGVRIEWDAQRLPLLVVRDAATGEILSLARGGSVELPAQPGRLLLVASDGTRSLQWSMD